MTALLSGSGLCKLHLPALWLAVIELNCHMWVLFEAAYKGVGAFYTAPMRRLAGWGLSCPDELMEVLVMLYSCMCLGQHQGPLCSDAPCSCA